ncbi:MAG TPA: tyrosine-type recombinase/integrase [Bryobacteraceae bacterium]|nr:tyrosine-type recombinase/integrase [Bryobacteraceae bacterium]
MISWRKAVEEYIEMRRSLGFKLLDAKVALIQFSSFLQKRRAAHITIALAMEWAQQNKTARPAEWARRLSFVRGFARHRSAHDPQTEVPPSWLLPHRPARAHPYLYSNDEVRKLLQAARLLPSGHGLRGPTYFCLLGLLAVAGVRISEARNLQTEDVDLKEGVLTIRGTKFGKSRLVPIHPSTRKVLRDYASRRDRFLAGRSATFFVSGRGTRLDGAEIRRTFYFLSRQIGLRGPTDSHGPRLHDFRHRFAVETLVQWYRSGQDVERRLPVLSTYLGHVHVADTYWYLSACPELMGLAVKRFEDYWEKQS